MADRITVTLNNHVANVKLNRADKMNALDDAMFNALIDTGQSLRDNPDVRAVVVSGEGRAFCAGLDLSNFIDEDAASGIASFDLMKRTHGLANFWQQTVWVWRTLPVPVIAAVHGTAFGGGFQLMLGADMRYIAPGTRLSVMEVKWGLIPDMTGTQLMRHLARDDIIRELTYTGRIFSETDALDYGFATRVCEDPHAEALRTAEEIAGKSPDATEAAKRLLNNAPYLSQADGLLAEAREQQALIGSPNQLESVSAGFEKRDAHFAPSRKGRPSG